MYALSVIEFNKKGKVTEKRLKTIGSLADLEGLAIGKNGYIYAITSHAKIKKGQRKCHTTWKKWPIILIMMELFSINTKDKE